MCKEKQNANQEAIKTFSKLLALSDEEFREYFITLEKEQKDLNSQIDEIFKDHFWGILAD